MDVGKYGSAYRSRRRTWSWRIGWPCLRRDGGRLRSMGRRGRGSRLRSIGRRRGGGWVRSIGGRGRGSWVGRVSGRRSDLHHHDFRSRCDIPSVRIGEPISCGGGYYRHNRDCQDNHSDYEYTARHNPLRTCDGGLHGKADYPRSPASQTGTLSTPGLRVTMDRAKTPLGSRG